MTERIKKSAIERIGEFERFGSVLGLERISALLAKLGDPQKDLGVIHVAGTNGKGSVCRYIYEGLQANGYKVGLYTSPFIERFEERIEFDYRLISEEDLEKYTDRVIAAAQELIAEGSESPTEFEIVTAIALCYFKDQNADFVILEVGLGGRGDSTNVIERPLISIITSIGYDHMDRLGDTLAEIAGEKAGIIKPGVPVVMNVEEREPAVVIAREAYKNGCVLHDVSKTKWYKTEDVGYGSCFNTFIEGTDYGDVEISMAGEHQIENAVTALTAIEILRKAGIISVERTRLYEGLKKAVQKGRFEVIGADEKFVLDGAHNPDGMEALVGTVDDIYYGSRVLVVMGVLADKAVGQIVELAQHMADEFIITEPDNPRKMPADELAAMLTSKGKECIVCPVPADAVKKAKEMADDYDVVICAGSLYLIGEIRKLLREGSIDE
ncbi:MAG: bifunctional folylpolyglutamate synthase/dihydrofolate synthase [Firmicutes bacterium]|nr:bifunctional folylpolyglutamate synthase/dihydrofolate synthase [Bacillota bacterium]